MSFWVGEGSEKARQELTIKRTWGVAHAAITQSAGYPSPQLLPLPLLSSVCSQASKRVEIGSQGDCHFSWKQTVVGAGLKRMPLACQNTAASRQELNQLCLQGCDTLSPLHSR